MKNPHFTVASQTVEEAHIAELLQQRDAALGKIRQLEGEVAHWRNQYTNGRIDLRVKVVNPMRAALHVLIRTPYIRTFLEQNDPQALEQAERAAQL